MRIAVGGIVHETNTYANESGGMTMLDAFSIARGDRIVISNHGTGTTMGGVLAACTELGDDVVPLLYAVAWPSGTIDASAYATLKNELIERLTAAMPVDAVALELHGAGVVDGTHDLEGDLGQAVREVVGPDVPIVAAFDLHGNATQQMVDVFDGGLYACHLYPHTDMADRGDEIIRLVHRIVAGEVNPVTRLESLPMLLPPATTVPGEPAAEMNDLCAAIEQRPGIIDCSVFHGFPFVDVEHVGVHVVCTSDGDADAAEAGAGEVADWIWTNRERFRHENETPEGSVRRAQKLVAEGVRPIVINETNDNPGGAPGDATYLLRAMLDAKVANACFGFVCDAEFASAAIAVGVGNTVTAKLGGKHDSIHGEPIDVVGRVKAITDGRFTLQRMMEGVKLNLGPSVRVVIDGVDVVVTSKPFQTMDDEIFVIHGIDVTRYDVIGLKSSQHFRAGFAELAGAIVTSDAPGLTTTRTEVFAHELATRPLWPRDADAVWP